MSNNPIGRFFSIKNAGIALATLLGGAAFGAYCVFRVLDQGRISLGGFAVSGLLVLVGLALFATAFPKGCRRCKRAFDSTGVSFPGNYYGAIEQALSNGDEHGLLQMQTAPLASGEIAKINIEHCAGCRALGTAQVERSRYNGQYSETLETGALHVVTGSMVATLANVTAARTQMSG
ncbi:MAG: hypothetical protein KC776_37680 [Myxococcales bacterium]|nr:hypothetical protein [Myxococcales bacterium]MCB9578283.1 hypothetical protein [Polyangiaceae bacterium]